MAQDFAKKKTNNTPPSKSAKPVVRQRKPSTTHNSSAKTHKRKNNTRKPIAKKQTPPLWIWLLIVLCVIGFAFFLTQLSQKKNAASNPETAKKAAQKSEAIEEKNSQVAFDFYEILKGKEVNVDDRVIEKTPEQKNIIYYLQAGSFKQASDADTLRAKLLLQGLSVSVEKTTNKNGQEWHRVVAGPFDTRSKLAKARGILASNEINSIVLKR